MPAFDWLLHVAQNTWAFVVNPANAASLVATAFAIWSAVSAHLAQRKASASARLAAERETAALALQSKATELQQDAVRFEYQKMLLDWADAVLAEVSHARQFLEEADGTPDLVALEEKRRQHSRGLSTLLDRGRLFFQNVSRDRVGLDRPAEMRGYRPPILDAIALAYFLVQRFKPDTAKKSAEILADAARCFLVELKRYTNGGAQEYFEAKGVNPEIRWDAMEIAVQKFEMLHGPQSFWFMRPVAKSELPPA